MEEKNSSSEKLLKKEDEEEPQRLPHRHGHRHQAEERKLNVGHLNSPRISSPHLNSPRYSTDEEEDTEEDQFQEHLSAVHDEEEGDGEHDDHEAIEDEKEEERAQEQNKPASDQKDFVVVRDDGGLTFATDRVEDEAISMETRLLMTLGRYVEAQKKVMPKEPKVEKKLQLIEVEPGHAPTTEAGKGDGISQREKVKDAMKKRKIVRYSAYFTYVAVLILGFLAFFKYSLIRNTVAFYNVSDRNTTLKLAIDNCSLYIMDPDETLNISAPIFVQYFMPPGHETGSASIGSQIITENSLTVNILNAGDPYYCLGKLYIRADVTPLDSLEITCGKCNITQDTSSQLQINGLLNLTGDSLHANFRNVKVGSVSYQSFTGHLQFNNIDSDNGINNIELSGEGDIIIQSTQDYVVNATTNTQAFCFGGTTLTSLDNGTCIYSDQDSPTPSRYKTCTLAWTVCLSEECAPTSFPTYVINSTNGNIYANAIRKIGTPVIPKQLVSGQIYNQGIAFSTTAEEVLESFDQYVADPDKSNPFVVLNVGDIASRSSKYAKWIVSSVPSYALMRPWWIGTFSGAMLNGYVKGANGILLPGFCPFYPDYTTQDLLTMQNLVFSKILTPYTLVTFVIDESMDPPTEKHQNYTGVFPLIGSGNPSDWWFSLGLSAGGNILLESMDYTKKGEILAAIFVSLSIAAYVTYLTLTLTGVSINMIYVKLVDFSSHLANYSKLEKSKEKEKLEGEQDEQQQKPKKAERKNEIQLMSAFSSKHSMIDFLKYAPSPLAFIDYVSLIFLRQFSNSVVQFYFLLFREQTQGDDQELDPNQNMMKGTEVKALYEKFCFMNHLNEQKLTDPINHAILKTYGFEIVTREDLKSEVFTRLTLKKKTPFLVNPKLIKMQNSLECYVTENVKLTQFDEDQIEVKEFIRLYDDFCSYNRLPRAQISPSLMKEKYSINVNFVPQQYILRIQEPAKVEGEDEDDYMAMKFMKKGVTKLQSYVPVKETKRYFIDKSKIENHFKLVMDETENMTDTQLEEATTDLILYPGWPLWDAFTVLLHLLLSALITAPLVYFVVLNESQYQPWSLKDNQYLIRYNDFFHDPLQFCKNLYGSFTWNVALMIVATSLWIVSSFDLMLYYAIMEFPQDKSFKTAQIQVQENIVERVSRQAEWMFVLMALIFYFLYISLILIWLLLGAFINPTTFLPFASAAITFVVFVISKFKAFKDVSQQGTKKITTYVRKLFGTFTNSVLGKIAKSFEKSGRLQIVNPDEKKGSTEAIIVPQAAVPVSNFQDLETTSLEEQELPKFQKEQSQSATVIKALNPSDLKSKKFQRVKEECAKRNIPTQITNFMLSIFLQDHNKQKQHFQKVLQDLNVKKKLSAEGANIITELIFPQGINKEEIVLYINIQILSHVFKEAGMNEIKGFTPEILYEFFMMFKELDEHQYDRFIQKFKQRLTMNKKIRDQIELFLPTLDIAAILSKDKPDHWNIKHACFKLFRLAEHLHLKEREQDESDECKSTIEKFVKFLPLMFSVYEVPYYVDDPKRLMDSKECLSVIENFCDAIGGFKNFQEIQANEDQKNPISVPDLIYLGISMIKHEAGDLPRRVTRAIEEPFDAEMPSNKFLPFCLNLTNVLYNKPDSFYQRLTKSAATFGVSTELQNFLKIVTCYHMRGFEARFPDTMIERNYYFNKMAEQMKAKPKELLGLIDLLSGRRNSKYITYFYQAILIRMNLKSELLEILKSVCSILLIKDEAIILQAVKTLELDLVPFLLIGKHLLNPRFMPSKLFEDNGIVNSTLLNAKDTIYYAPREQFSAWKAGIRAELTANMSNYKSLFEEENKKEKNKENPELNKYKTPEEFNASATLIKFYFSDWKNFTYSKKNIVAAINALSNPANRLRIRLTNIEQGKDFNGIDYIVRVMVISILRLENGRKFNRLDKEKENAIIALAEYLGFNPEVLNSFMKIFLLNDREAVMKSFFSFFEDEQENETEISKILGFGFTQVAGVQRQLDFIHDELSNSIDFFGNDLIRVPSNLIKKIYFGTSFGDLDLNDIQNLVSMKIHALGLDEEKEKKVYDQCIDLSLLSKGIILGHGDTSILTNNPKVVNLIRVLSEVNNDSKSTHITGMFAKYPNDADHPIKVAIALSGLLTHGKFTIKALEKPKDWMKLKNLTTAPKEVNLSISAYLGNVFNIHPEVFDLFYIVFERDVSRFFQKSLPLIRRLSGAPILDTNLLESLFSLSVGEKFNTYNLSEKLGVSPDIIEFFLSLVRITDKAKREKELELIGESISVGQILAKLKVKTEEFLYLLKLIFNEFEVTEEGIGDILNNIGLKSEEGESGIVQVDFLRGLIAISTSTDSKLDIFKNKKELAQLQAKTATFWNFVELVDYKLDAFIIARLSTGNFLVLDEFKDHLGWIFPVHDDKAERAILNLTMGLFGLIYSNLEVTPELNAEVEAYVKEYYPKEIDFEEPEYQIGAPVLPNNSLAYAIYLTYQSLDIPTKWTQAFLFDKKAVKEIKHYVVNLNEEFLWSLILQFKSLNDVVGDLLGLYDWTTYCKEFYQGSRGSEIKLRPKVEEFMKNIDLVYGFFHDKMGFDLKTVEHMAGSYGLLEEIYFKKLFEDSLLYRNKVNQSLFYLLTIGKSPKEIRDLGEILKPSFRLAAVEFLSEFANVTKQQQQQNEQSPAEQRLTVGRLIKEAIVAAYEVVYEKTYPLEKKTDLRMSGLTEKTVHQPRYPGFAITDLCLLSDLTSLRSSSSYSQQRKLHCLHQILINIERKMIFDDKFCKMSKFKIMKLLGIALNMRISNLVEWCMTPSFFSDAYVTKLELAVTDEDKKIAKEERCELLLSEQNEALPEVKQDPITVAVGDLGYFTGGYKNFVQKMGQILEAESWDKINTALEFDSVYLIHPLDDNVVAFLDQVKDDDIALLKKCSLHEEEEGENKEIALDKPEKQEREVAYRSKELVEIVFGQKAYKELPAERMNYNKLETKELEGKSTKELLENMIDIKTGVPYKELMDRSMCFENTLMNDNMALILGITRGEPADIIEGNHILNKQDPTNETTKIYMSLLGLQSYMKKEKRNRLIFTSYLRYLSGYIESDVIALDELLNFLITRKRRTKFTQVTSILDVNDHILTLLLISIEAAEKDDDDDEDISFYASVAQADLLKTVSKDHLEAIEIIRQIYLLKEPRIWIYVIEKLRKDIGGNREIRFLRRLFSMVNFTSFKKWKKDEDQSGDYVKHELEMLVDMINFTKLRKQVLAGEDKQIFKAMGTAFKDYNECMCHILENIVLHLDCYQQSAENKRALRDNYDIINLLLQKNFSSAFELMILEDSKNSKGWPKAEEVLKEFDVVNTSPQANKDIKIFVLFVMLSQSNLSSFRNTHGYQTAINRVIEDLVDERILDPFKDSTEKDVASMKISDKDFQTKLSRLMVGALAWDFNLCINGLATQETIKEGYLLYSLYACLNMDKILSFKKAFGNPTVHLRALLPLIFPALLSKSTSSGVKDNRKEIFKDIIIKHFGTNTISEVTAKTLETKSDELFHKLQRFDQKRQPTTLSKRICDTFEDGEEEEHGGHGVAHGAGGTAAAKEHKEPLTFSRGKDKEYQIYEEILCSFCDGTILIRLINTFVDQDKKEENEKVGQKALKAFFHFLLEFKSFYGGKVASDHVHNAFIGLINSFDNLKQKNTWRTVLRLAPNILDMLLTVQKDDGQLLEKQKNDVLRYIGGLVAMNTDNYKKELLFDTMTVMLRSEMGKIVPVKKNGEKKTQKAKEQAKIRYDMDIEERFNIFFVRVCDKLFSGMGKSTYFKDNHQKVYRLLALINLDYVEKIDDRKYRHKIVKTLLDTFEDLKICNKINVKVMLDLLNGNIEGSEVIILGLGDKISPEGAKIISDYLVDAQKYFKSDMPIEIKALAPAATTFQANKLKVDSEEWNQIMKKIKEGNTSSRDLFRMVDQEGDRSGTINEAEFLILAGRLGLKLSDHRVKEIFAKVKGAKVQDADYNELNEEEFEKALTYLEDKNLLQAMELLGITPEILTAILIRLVILLLLIFVFLYLGLKAFAIGGTFGSIVNSIFPVAGGVALGKDKQGEENLDDDKVKDATDKGFEIATSGDL